MTISDAHEAGTAVPTADWVSLVELAHDPFAVAARLRAEGSALAFVPSFERIFVFGHAECRAVENDSESFGPLVTRSLLRRAVGPNMLTKGDPDHDRERRAINPAVRPKTVDTAWLPLFHRHAERFLEDLVAAGPGADAVELFAVPYASANLAAIIGLPNVPWTDLCRWSKAFIAAAGNHADDPDIWLACERAGTEADAAIDEAIVNVRREPDASMLSAMINGPVDVPVEVLRSNIKLAISGGINEPQHTLVNGLWAFDRHPDQLAQLLESPDRFAAAFDEVVRWFSPVGSLGRVVLKPVTLAGVELAPGTELMLMLGGANRDPLAFDDPDQFNIFRERRPHLGFGAGIHLCAGTWASRGAIAKVAWPMLYQRLAGLRPLAPDKARWLGFTFRGLDALPLTWQSDRKIN